MKWAKKRTLFSVQAQCGGMSKPRSQHQQLSFMLPLPPVRSHSLAASDTAGQLPSIAYMHALPCAWPAAPAYSLPWPSLCK